MTKLDKALSGIKKIVIDTSIIIYFMESNPLYDKYTTPILL